MVIHYFAGSARTLAKSNGVVVWERDTLITHIVRTSGHIQPKARPTPIALDNREPPSMWRGYLIEQPSGRVVSLAKNLVLIGRDPVNDLVITSDSVSRYHAQVIFEHGQPVLIDLDSKNGTRVNGSRIILCSLNAGDHIQIEQTVFVYSLRPFLPRTLEK